MFSGSVLKTSIYFAGAFAIGALVAVYWLRWRVSYETTPPENHSVLLSLFRKQNNEYLQGVTEESLDRNSLVAYAEILKGRLRDAGDENSALKKKIADMLFPIPSR